MTTFYDKNGKPIAYVEDGEHIFLFDGTPVGFLDGDSIYSFDGKHLGWLTDGWVIDHSGGRVFFTENASGGPMTPMKKMKPMKSMKQMKPMKGMKEMEPMTPMLSNTWSDLSSKAFFHQ